MDNTPLLFSIVTPSFNQAQYIEETLQSVFAQTYPHWEYIVIDGGSTDGSQQIIQKYAHRLAYYVSEKDEGQTDAINKGFSYAKGDILAWLNADDVYECNTLKEVADLFLQYPDVGLIYGDALLIDDKSQVIGKFPSRQTSYRLLRHGSVHIPQQAAFFPAQVWREVAPLDPTFYFAMDYDLWIRIAKRYPIKYIPRVWAKFRLHQNTKTKQADDRCYPEMLRVHYREGGSFFSIIVLKAMFRKLFYSWLPLKWKVWIRSWVKI